LERVKYRGGEALGLDYVVKGLIKDGDGDKDKL